MTDTQTIEVGASGTVTASFQDAFGNDATLKNVTWNATGGVVIIPDPTNPLIASIQAWTAGPSTISAVGEGVTGVRTTLEALVQVSQVGGPVTGSLVLQ
jgi:hypothetical protein